MENDMSDGGPLCCHRQSSNTSSSTSYDEFGTGRSLPNDTSRISQHPTSNEEKVARFAREYGINLAQPKHPQYAIKATRLGTFRDWLRISTQSAESMAEAGFFHPPGNNDVVFCFYCGVGLEKWEEGDEPWGEHARWSPNCVFVINIKGQEFIEIEQLRNSNPEEYLIRKTRALGMDSTDINRNGLSAIDTMNSPAILSLLQNGYQESMVKQAAIVFYKRNRDMSPSAKDLLQIIFDIEDNSIPFEEITLDEPVAQRGIDKAPEDELTCRRCYSNQVSVVFLPCGHLCTCSDCSSSVKHCLLCKKLVKGTVRTYMT
ncbi:baculoviral IAP repeat-containing protein 8-like [Crassostrea virginica]